MTFKTWDGHCQRCGKETSIRILSMFNTQDICPDCKDAEEAHPDYQKACDAEHAAVLDGNRNFLGIGLPADLNPSNQNPEG